LPWQLAEENILLFCFLFFFIYSVPSLFGVLK